MTRGAIPILRIGPTLLTTIPIELRDAVGLEAHESTTHNRREDGDSR